MQLTKLDKKRSYDASKTYEKDELTYCQINDSDEVCVLVNEPNDAEKIQERICVPPVKYNSNSAQLRKYDRIPEGEYRVTTMLIDFDYEYNWRKLTDHENNPLQNNPLLVKVPKYIERVYFSEKCANHAIKLEVVSDGHLCCNNGVMSLDKNELFSYGFFREEEKKDINLPDKLNVIHSYAFMCAEIKTLRIPAAVTEIGKGAFWNANIDNIIFEGKWTEDIDPEAFTNLKVSGSIRINDTAQNVSLYNELLKAVDNDCNRLILAAPHPCEEVSPSIGYIRVTQAYYHGYPSGWNNIIHNEGIIDINSLYIVSVKDYEIPTYIPVKGSFITLYEIDNDKRLIGVIVYEPKEMVLEKIDAAVKQINATGSTVEELIDRIKTKIK